MEWLWRVIFLGLWGFYCKARNTKLTSDISFAVVPKSLKLAQSSYPILRSSNLLRRWGLRHELPFTKQSFGTVCTIQGPSSWYSKAANTLLYFLFASFWFNQLSFRSCNDRWPKECKISQSGPIETTYYILGRGPDILHAGHGLAVCVQHADIF